MLDGSELEGREVEGAVGVGSTVGVAVGSAVGLAERAGATVVIIRKGKNRSTI